MKESFFNKEKLFNFQVDRIDKIESFKDGIMEQAFKKIANDIDDMLFEFLNKEGYKIEKPYTVEQVTKIKEQLDKENKYVDYIEVTQYKKGEIVKHYFPYIWDKDSPLSQANKKFLAQKYIKSKGIEDVI